jgi:hypothetical protein
LSKTVVPAGTAPPASPSASRCRRTTRIGGADLADGDAVEGAGAVKDDDASDW